MEISERELMLHRKLAGKDDKIRSLQAEVDQLKEENASYAEAHKTWKELTQTRWDELMATKTEVERLRDTEKLIKDTVVAAMDAFWNTPVPLIKEDTQ